jgi:glucose/arabinose dehydrogenase
MKKKQHVRVPLMLCVLLFHFAVAAQHAHEDSYTVETIEMPKGLAAQTGGIDFLPDGRLIACFMRGEVMTYNHATKEWKLFASGLQYPLGILAISNSEVLVMQIPNLVRIKDTDGDGEADLYENATSDFGISGNYHEFNYGPVRDKAGNVFIVLNCGSSGGGVRPIVRGELNTHGREGLDGRRQMFSVVPYRGWVLQLTPDGKMHPFASGFRSPNGIGFDPDGNLFVADNQSDWVPTSSLYHVRKDNFYGHPASLVWRKEWKDRDPFNASIAELDKIRTRAAVQFPQGIMASSPSQPLADMTKGKFGPFTGQLFIGELNRDRILRVMMEKVDGEFQGACIPFLDGHGLRAGNNRLAFAPDGSLWTGQISFGGWPGVSGIQRIVFKGTPPMDIYTMSVTKNGFDLTFTQPVESSSASDVKNYKIRSYRYEYKKKDFNEGIDVANQFDVQDENVTVSKISEDGKKISLQINDLKQGYIYEFTLGEIKSKTGQPLANSLVCYTLNKLRTLNNQ